MNEDYKFRLGFLTANEAKAVMNIPFAESSLMSSEVKDAMNSIIAAGIVEHKGDLITTRHEAELVRNVIIDYNVA